MHGNELRMFMSQDIHPTFTIDAIAVVDTLFNVSSMTQCCPNSNTTTPRQQAVTLAMPRVLCDVIHSFPYKKKTIKIFLQIMT